MSLPRSRRTRVSELRHCTQRETAGSLAFMEQIVAKLVEKVGLDEGTAKKVADFIKEHADEIPGWLAKAGVADKLPGGLGKLF